MKRSCIAMVMFLTLITASVGCAENPDPVTQPDTDAVVATFAGGEISAAELEETAGPSLAKLRQQIYDTKVQVLQEEIFGRLIDAEAAAAGVTKDEYMKTNVSDKVGEPPAEEIDKVMQQYRARLPQDDEEARSQVTGFLRSQQQQQHLLALREQLFAGANVKILLDPPRVEFAMAEYNPSRGPENAAVTVVEYTDFQCPYCVRVQGTLDAIMVRYGDNVRHVFKHLPLPMHQQAGLAAEASLCANDQGGFWPLHDWMFTNSRNLGREALLAQAEAQSLDVAAFTACLDDKKYAQAVQDDMKEAQGFGITGTPGFLVNGRVLTGAQPLEAFVEIINDELRRAGLPIPPEPEPEPKPVPKTTVEKEPSKPKVEKATE